MWELYKIHLQDIANFTFFWHVSSPKTLVVCYQGQIGLPRSFCYEWHWIGSIIVGTCFHAGRVHISVQKCPFLLFVKCQHNLDIDCPPTPGKNDEVPKVVVLHSHFINKLNLITWSFMNELNFIISINKLVSVSLWNLWRKTSVLKSKGWALCVLLWDRPNSWTMKLTLIH